MCDIVVNMKNHELGGRVKFGKLLLEEETTSCSGSSCSRRLSSFSNFDNSNDDDNNNNVMPMSPWSNQGSPYHKSPWIKLSPYPHPTLTGNSNGNGNGNGNSNSATNVYLTRGKNCLIGSLFREEGHVYSVAVKDGMLITGSDSKNIRVWSNFHDVGGFKSGSGLVKAIIVTDRVFTGHQDGKIRVWSLKGKRLTTFPRLMSSININPKKLNKKIRHIDAVSCMSLSSQETGLLYSGSWDKCIKVWKVSNGKCLESIEAHDDAINSIVVGLNGLVFSGSADGSVKAWRRETAKRHIQLRTLLTQDSAVTGLAVSDDGCHLYAGSSDGLVNFWEISKYEMRYGGALRGHKMGVLCLATAGCLVFSGSADKSICVWKRHREDHVHTCLAVLSGHDGPVKCLAVEQQRDDEEQWVVYSGSLDKSVKIWRVSQNAPDHQLTY